MLGFSDETQEVVEQAGRSAAAVRVVKEKGSMQLPARRQRRQCRGLRREWQVSTSTPCEQNERVGCDYSKRVQGIR